MRVLVLSAEVWRDDRNGGNVLSNIFDGLDAEFAQVYCNPGEPRNGLCRKYYQMTDSMVIRNFLKHRPIGKAFELGENEQKEETKPEKPNKKFYSFFRNHRLSIFHTAQMLVWNLSNWKNKGLDDFIKDFAPDIIFAPCYGNTFMLRLTRYVAKLTGKKVISYISDDSYTLKQFNLSPFYWINRFAVRRQLRKTFPYYSLVYTMTELQKQQCERDFGANMKILLKSASFGEIPKKTTVFDPIRIVYAGGVYLNRWKTLAYVADIIREINKDGICMRLDIYTGNEISRKMNNLLNDGKNSFIHGVVSQSELKEIYRNSDVALHVESFDLKNRLAVRMSFSTKIVDCLSGGCAVMAICDEKQGGFVYLKTEKAAICASKKEEVRYNLIDIKDNPKIVLEYSDRAKKCCEINHNREIISKMIKEDFMVVCCEK